MSNLLREMGRQRRDPACYAGPRRAGAQIPRPLDHVQLVERTSRRGADWHLMPRFISVQPLRRETTVVLKETKSLRHRQHRARTQGRRPFSSHWNRPRLIWQTGSVFIAASRRGIWILVTIISIAPAVMAAGLVL